jgi:cobalt/nickel transport system permease protein
MIDDLFLIEGQAYRRSIIHSLDARVKILLSLAVIIAIVAFPYSREVMYLGAIFFLLFVTLWLAAFLSPLHYLKRLVMILPFGIFIIGFQLIFQNPYYEVFHPVVDLPLGIHIYAESIEFAGILLVKFLVCISFIILLSSTTKMQDMLEGAGRLGLPAEFTLMIGMMVRYLFVFAEMLRKIRNSLDTRCFDPFNNSLPYRYRVRQLGYTIGMMFIRSYEQGERTYVSMLCRGYGMDSHLYIGKKPMNVGEWVFLTVSFLFVIGASVGVFLYA